MRFKKVLASALAVIMSLALAACGSTGTNTAAADKPAADASGSTPAMDSGAAGESAAAEDTVGDTVITLTENWDFSTGFYPVINSNISNNYGVMYWCRNFYNTLVSYDKNGEIQGELAESFDVSEDGLTYTFILRDDVKFSDGTPLTSSAVKLSFETAIEKLGAYNGSYGKLTTIITSMDASDDETLVLTLSQPYYGALNDLTMLNPMGIVNPGAFSGDPHVNCAEQTMGTGPYMFAGDYDGTAYTFVRNPNYWGEAPEVDSFRIKVIADNDAKVMALRSGEIDAIIGSTRLSYDGCSELSKNDAYGTVVNDNGTMTRYLGFNLNAAPFNDIRIRQAVAYAIDRDTLCSSVFQGIEKPADTLFQADKPYCDVSVTTYDFDLNRARALMDEAGWIDSDGDGVREKDGMTLELQLPYLRGMTTLDDAALAISSQLSEVGFKLIPSGNEMMTWFSILMAGDYQITMYQTYGGAYDPSTVVTNMNPASSTDPIAVQVASALEGSDVLFAELNSTSDLAQVQKIYAQILGTIADKALMVPVSYAREFAVWRSDVMTGYDFLFDDQYVNVAGIHIDTLS